VRGKERREIEDREKREGERERDGKISQWRQRQAYSGGISLRVVTFPSVYVCAYVCACAVVVGVWVCVCVCVYHCNSPHEWAGRGLAWPS
jgi:hypothetical protein